MTVYKRDGKWRVQVDMGRDAQGRRRRASPKDGPFRTKREAQEAEAKLIAGRAGGLVGISSRSTLGTFLEEWLRLKAALGGSPTSRHDREHTTRGYIIPALGAIPLAKLTAPRVQDFILDMLERGGKRGGGLSPARVRAMHQILHAALEYAAGQGFIQRNIMGAVQRPKQEKRAKPLWSVEQMDRFLAAIEGDDWRALYWLAMFGGLRRAELLGLRWADVDLQEGYLLVRETWVHAEKGTPKPPKSSAGKRVVTLGPGTVAALTRHRAAQRELSMKNRIVWQDNDLVFCREDGTHCYPTAPTQRFAKLVERLGLPHVSLHDLRKIAASLANVASQGDARSVSDRLGHSRVDTSQQIYVKGLVERQRGIAEGVERLVRRQG